MVKEIEGLPNGSYVIINQDNAIISCEVTGYIKETNSLKLKGGMSICRLTKLKKSTRLSQSKQKPPQNRSGGNVQEYTQTFSHIKSMKALIITTAVLWIVSLTKGGNPPQAGVK